MTPEAVFERVAHHRPPLVYISGKTSTGKSTFARRLHDELGYDIIELDRIVVEEVMPELGLTDRGKVFIDLFKHREAQAAIKHFVAVVHERMAAQQAVGRPAVIEGAIANPITLKEVFDGQPNLLFLYFHPKNLDTYVRNITNRFKTANETSEGGLPINFWNCMGRERFAEFCRTRIVTPAMTEAIHMYAQRSQASSVKRLESARTVFPDLVEVVI